MTVRIITGDCRTVLATLPAKSINCCVTSPPYFGLRDYGNGGQMGLEKTPDEYVEQLVGVFREVWRVLRDDGTVWLNLGDSYAANRGYQVPDSKHKDVGNSRPMRAATIGLKEKDLIGIPWRVAFALQADGWYLRQDIIWAKPNPMPESVTDRCTKAHEYVFLLSKSAKYYFDADAIREPYADDRKGASGTKSLRYSNESGRNGDSGLGGAPDYAGRNKRSVWVISPKSFKEAHFATFPPKLIEPCILAGCPEGGTVLDPFGGAGTTGLVAEQRKRNSILIELNPAYVDIALRRIHGDVI